MRVGLSKHGNKGFVAPSRSPSSSSSASSSGKKPPTPPPHTPQQQTSPRETPLPSAKKRPAEREAEASHATASAGKASGQEKRESALSPSLPGATPRSVEAKRQEKSLEWRCGECGAENVDFQELCEFCDAVRVAGLSSLLRASPVAAAPSPAPSFQSAGEEKKRAGKKIGGEAESERTRVETALAAAVQGAERGEIEYAAEVAQWAKNSTRRRQLLRVAMAQMEEKTDCLESGSILGNSLQIVEEEEVIVFDAKRRKKKEEKEKEKESVICSSEAEFFLKSVNSEREETIRIAWDREVTFCRHDSIFGLVDDSRYCVADLKVSATHCRVAIRNDSELWLIDSSTNGTYLQLGEGKKRIASKKISSSQFAEWRLRVGDFFALSLANDLSWRHVWQVCGSANDSVASGVVFREEKKKDYLGNADLKKRLPPTEESMARVVGKKEKTELERGDEALAKVLAEANTKKKKGVGPKIVSAGGEGKNKKKMTDAAAEESNKRLREGLREAIVERKKNNSNPSPPVISSEQVVIDCCDEEEEEKSVFKAPQQRAASSMSFSLSLGN